MTRVEYAISTYKNLTLEEVEDFNKAMGLLPDSIDQYAEYKGSGRLPQYRKADSYPFGA